MNKQRVLLLLGLCLIAYIIVYPKHNNIRARPDLLGLYECNPQSECKPTVLFQELDRAVFSPQGSRPFIPLLQLAVAEFITAGKFDRKNETRDNLFYPLFKPLIYQWLNYTTGGGYQGSRTAVLFIATYFIDWLFMFIALGIFYLIAKRFKLSLAAIISGFLYLTLFTLYNVWHPSRWADISSIASWMAISYFFIYWFNQQKEEIKTKPVKRKSNFVFLLVTVIVSFLGVLCRESAIVVSFSAAAVLLFTALRHKKSLRIDYAPSLAFIVGSLCGFLFFLNWPQADNATVAIIAQERIVHMPANLGAFLPILEKFSFPFVPHIFLLLFFKTCREKAKDYSWIFLFTMLAVAGNLIVHFVVGAGLVSEGQGQLAANISPLVICFCLLIEAWFIDGQKCGCRL